MDVGCQEGHELDDGDLVVLVAQREGEVDPDRRADDEEDEQEQSLPRCPVQTALPQFLDNRVISINSERGEKSLCSVEEYKLSSYQTKREEPHSQSNLLYNHYIDRERKEMNVTIINYHQLKALT